MERLTRTELAWLIQSVEFEIKERRDCMEGGAVGFSAALNYMRVENLKTVAGKLRRVLDNGGKRIAVE